MRSRESLFALALLGACAPEPRDVGWTLRFADDALRMRAVRVEVEMREGDCSGDVLYEESVLVASPSGALPPRVGRGAYCFRAEAIDTDCMRYAAGDRVVSLPEQSIELDLVALAVVEERCSDRELCSEGRCADAGCPDALRNCNGESFDGCEANLELDPAHCGACGNACREGESCSRGRCERSACPGSLRDCDGDLRCETDVLRDPLHCGRCDAICERGLRCEAGNCGCSGGREDCDRDGLCETFIFADPTNCGACGFACSRERREVCCDGLCCANCNDPRTCRGSER